MPRDRHVTAPRVSIVLPTRNRAHTLPRAVRSVLGQCEQDWELILVDDGSTDDTPAYRAKLRAALGARYREAETTGGTGAAAARNRGIALARAPRVAFLDSDDGWEPEKLHAQLAAMDANPAATLCFTAHAEFAPGGHALPPPPPIAPGLEERAYPLLLSVHHNCVTTPSVVAPRAALEAEGGFDEAMRICEDIDLWTRLARRGPVIALRAALTLVERRDPERFPYAESLHARADLYARAGARDEALLPMLRPWGAQLLDALGTAAAVRRDEPARRLLRRAAPGLPEGEALPPALRALATELNALA